MVSQSSTQLKPQSVSSVEWSVPAAREQLDSLRQWLLDAARVGPGDVGPTAPLDNSRTVCRLQEHHSRRLLTVFGAFVLSGYVYAQRDGQQLERAPTDQRLQLPEAELSYLLQECDQRLGVEHAFGRARDTLQAILRLKQSLDTLEHNNQHMAHSAAAFRESQPPVEKALELRVISSNGDWEPFPQFRIEQETNRLYPHTHTLDAVDWPFVQAI